MRMRTSHPGDVTPSAPWDPGGYVSTVHQLIPGCLGNRDSEALSQTPKPQGTLSLVTGRYPHTSATGRCPGVTGHSGSCLGGRLRVPGAEGCCLWDGDSAHGAPGEGPAGQPCCSAANTFRSPGSCATSVSPWTSGFGANGVRSRVSVGTCGYEKGLESFGHYVRDTQQGNQRRA